MSEKIRFLSQYKPTRRELLIGGGALALGGLAGRLSVGATPQTPETPKPEAQPTLNDIANNILSKTPHSPERVSLEHSYIAQLEKSKNITLQNINIGLMVTSDPFVRGSLMDERLSLRNSGQEKLLSKTPEDKLNWIKTYRIHPETLGICLDAYPKAKSIIETLIKNKKLRDDDIVVSADEAMLNPGGMAMLINTETGGVGFSDSYYGFSYIGGGIAVNEINEKVFPNAKTALTELARQASAETGLKFDPSKIPGSKRGNTDENISGGAISIQFMPDNALKIYNLIKENTGKSLNVFDVEDATIMAWVFLARHEKVGDDFRYGYRRGYENEIKLTLAKWNPSPIQIDTIYNTAVSYFSSFIKDGKYAY